MDGESSPGVAKTKITHVKVKHPARRRFRPPRTTPPNLGNSTKPRCNAELSDLVKDRLLLRVEGEILALTSVVTVATVGTAGQKARNCNAFADRVL